MFEILEATADIEGYIREVKKRKMYSFVTQNNSSFDFDMATAYALTGYYEESLNIMTNFEYPQKRQIYNTIYSNNMYCLSAGLDLNNTDYWLNQLDKNAASLNQKYKHTLTVSNYNLALYHLLKNDIDLANKYKALLNGKIISKYMQGDMLFYNALESENKETRIALLKESHSKHKSLMKKKQIEKLLIQLEI